MVDSKRCHKCDSIKAASEFQRSASRPDGLQDYCKPCRVVIQRGYRARHKAKNAVENPPPPPKPPLEQAYEHHAAERERRDLKREHTALVEENTRLRAQLSEVGKMRAAPEVIVYKQAAHMRGDAVACALASDWHVEEPVELASVHGLNEYNLDIAKSRAEHFFRNFLRLSNMAARDSKITTLYIGAVGDFFSGFIHDELISNNLLAPGDAAQFCKGLFFSGIDFLLRESSYVLEGDFIPGNHGRMTDKLWIGDPTGTSLETFMYHAIVDRYHANPRVRFKVASQGMVYRSFFEKFKLRLLHGYEVKYGGGVGGITIPLNKALAAWNNPIIADLTAFGHFHQFIDGGRFIGNGSLIGYNTFAQAIRAQFEPPRQAFFLIDARNGGEKSLVAPIWLEDSKR